MLNIAVIGYGYWGPNMVRNFNEFGGTCVKYVCDQDEKQLARVKALYPAVALTSNLDEVLNDPDIDAISIATPVSTHFEIALKALEAGKHVLVEKPITDSSEKAEKLIETAIKYGKVLMVDHTFPYTGAVRKIKELIEKGDLGDIYYYDSIRVNLGLFQRDVDVIWDLAVHDLSIIDYILPHQPIAVSATGMSHVEGQPENIAYLTLFFSNNTIVHINVNWLAPVKVRLTLIGGTKKMIVYDDLEQSEKVKVYDKGIVIRSDDQDSLNRVRIEYRTGDMVAPRLESREPLEVEAEHILSCVRNRTRPRADGEAGYRVTRILEAAQRSIQRSGAPVCLEGD